MAVKDLDQTYFSAFSDENTVLGNNGLHLVDSLEDLITEEWRSPEEDEVAYIRPEAFNLDYDFREDPLHEEPLEEPELLEELNFDADEGVAID